MPITVEHGPISAALQLAQRAGEAQRYQPRQFIDLTGQRRAEERKGKEFEMRQALEYEKLASRERLSQEELQRREVAFEAEQQYRGEQQKMAKGREERAVSKATQAEQIRKQFGERFGMSPEEFQAEMAQQREGRIVQKQETDTERRARMDDARKLEGIVKTKMGNVRMWEKASKQYNPFDSPNWTSEGAESIAQSLESARQEAMQAGQALEQAQLPQYGREVTAKTLAQASPQQQQMMVQQKAQVAAQAVARMIPTTMQNNPQAVMQATIQYLQSVGGNPNDPDVQQFAEMVTQMITGG